MSSTVVPRPAEVREGGESGAPPARFCCSGLCLLSAPRGGVVFLYMPEGYPVYDDSPSHRLRPDKGLWTSGVGALFLEDIASVERARCVAELWLSRIFDASRCADERRHDSDMFQSCFQKNRDDKGSSDHQPDNLICVRFVMISEWSVAQHYK